MRYNMVRKNEYIMLIDHTQQNYWTIKKPTIYKVDHCTTSVLFYMTNYMTSVSSF
jgi:hypothetical protein